MGGMVIAYGGQFGFSDRKSAIDAWKDVCEQFHIPVSKLGILEIFEPIVERSYLRADTLPPFDYYQENCLIVQKSKKWITYFMGSLDYNSVVASSRSICPASIPRSAGAVPLIKG